MLRALSDYCLLPLYNNSAATINVLFNRKIFSPHLGIYLLMLERGERKKQERERYIGQLPALCAVTGDQTENLGMCPDWELNPQPFGVWDDAPTK